MYAIADPNLAFSKFFELFFLIYNSTILLKKASKSNPWFDDELQNLQKLKRKA